MLRQIVLDTETTGLVPEEGHRIIEIGCVELIDRRFTGNNFHQYVNPQRNIDAGALAVHGITQAFLSNKPIFPEILAEFIDYIKNAELIIHNASFDVGFINNEFERALNNGLTVADYCRVFDTLTLARQKHPGQKNNLDALCKRYAVDNSNRDLHGALLDAELLAHVYLAMTGGQANLFSKVETISDTQTNYKKAETIQRKQALPIIVPDEEELKAHRAFLEIIKSESGSVVWTEN